MPIRYPEPIQPGDKIAVTAPSSGVAADRHARLDLVLQHLRDQGFAVVEGECLRSNHKQISAPKEKRAAEFMRFYLDPTVKAIMPPWGGEVLVEILPLLDFAKLRTAAPKWVSGFSDISTLLMPLTLLADVATVHGANGMDQAPKQDHPLPRALMQLLQLRTGEAIEQRSSRLYQTKWRDFREDPTVTFDLTAPTRWKVLNGNEGAVKFSGRLIGGCLDTVARLIGTAYAPVKEFYSRTKSDGAILYFENCELLPCEVARTLWQLRLAGWFDGPAGVLIGRSIAEDAKDESRMTHMDALRAVLRDLPMPILYDTDIGHVPPQINLVNGALVEVDYENGAATVRQTLS